MSKMTRAWIEAQIEHELERGNHPDAVRDLAALITVKNWMCHDEHPLDERSEHHANMRDKNIVNIHDYQDKRKMGIGENKTYHSGRSIDDHDEKGDMTEGDAHHMGAYPMMEQLTQESATAWVEGMKNSDPEHPTGAKWSQETTKFLAIKHGFNTPASQLEFWAVMNMMYSDYAETAKKHNVSTMDFYADMAKAWMRDKDGVKHKTAAYIACCTE